MDNKALSRNNPYFAPSDKVSEVKEFVKKLPELQKAFGDIIEFRLVVDTNIVLADIRWLAKNRKDGSMRTGLMEIIDAGTAMVYAPRKLVTEVNEHLPGIALEAGISLNLLRKEWLAYKSRLKIHVVARKLTAAHSNAADPNDAEFIVLADKIQAHGVISKDKHIKDMGGRKLSLDFVFSVRDYSRATAIELNVKYMGVSFGVLTLAMAAGLIELIKGAIGGIVKLPDWAKLLLLSGVIFAALHPPTREKIKKGYDKLSSGLMEFMPVVLERVNEAAQIAQQHKQIASKHLATANQEISKYDSQIRPVKRKVRIKRKSIRNDS